MRNIGYGLKALLFVLCFLTMEAHSGLFEGSLEGDAGYRYDKVTLRRGILIPELITVGNTYSLNNCESVIVGGKAELLVPKTRFLVRGQGHYGWLDGDYQEDRAIRGPALGNTVDASAAVGFVCTPWCDMTIIPLVGASYDYLQYKCRKTSRPVPIDSFELAFKRSKFEWYGPWIGINFVPQIECLLFNLKLGYEFHYGWCNLDVFGRATSPVANIEQWNRANCKNCQGHVFQLEGSRCAENGCFVKVGLQYTYWRVGASTPDKSNIEVVVPIAGVQTTIDPLYWNSFTLTASIGKIF